MPHGLERSSVSSEVRWKSLPMTNAVQALTGCPELQGAWEDPWNVLWSFNGTRDFYLFI